MATRFYPDRVNTPDVSPAYDGSWDETASALRRKLLLAIGATGSSTNLDTDTVNGPAYYLLWQLVTEPLDAISATLAVAKAAFLCSENNAKTNGYLHLVFRKCDGDGSNPVTIDSMTDDVEFNVGQQNRFIGSSNLTDQALSQGDRLIVEVGFYSNTSKDTGYTGTVYATSSGSGDFPENDTETLAYSSWIETGDTFTEASGEPAAIKLGPMFTFA